MKTTTISDLNRPADLAALGITPDNANSLQLVSVQLKDGRNVDVNRNFASVGNNDKQMVANYNHNGQDFRFVADTTSRQVSLENYQESDITGYTLGITA
ncbi:hypothetical protein LUCX_155 [Xanthomonas phage vB_XciM_LucasX]|nr:hypothetical protein LUCX_155 [Xanthomonas phage vB_XciM_LucasX]